MNEIKLISKIATVVRESLYSDYTFRNEINEMFNEFPSGCCGDTSLVLQRILSDYGIESTYTKGDFDRQTHVWLKYNDYYIDITADQFEGINDGVIISKEDPFEGRFSVDEESTILYIDKEDEEIISRLNEVYDYIIKYIGQNFTIKEGFTIDTMMNIIYSSIENMFRNQPDILESTTQTVMTEWNLGHHYSNELAKYLYWFDNDNDVTKSNYNRKRPDILFHKRKVNAFNFLVIELKKSRNINQADKVKINANWLSGDLSYRFGACVSIINKTNYSIWIKDRLMNRELVHDVNNRNRLDYKEIVNDKPKEGIRECMEPRKQILFWSILDELMSTYT